MRIAVIGTRGVPASHGGVERHVEELCSRLARMGFEVDVYVRRHYIQSQQDKIEWESPMRLGRYRGMRLIVSGGPRVQGVEALVHSLWATLLALARRYDLYHYHALGPSFFAQLPLALGKRVAVTVHGLDWQREKWGWLASAYLRHCERFIGRRIPTLICVSEDLKQHFEVAYDREAVYLPNGIEIPERIEAAEIPEWGLKAGEYILFCGRLTPEKGVHTLIESFQRAHSLAGVKLVIAGGAEQNPAYLESLKRLASERVVFTGYAFGEALIRLMSNCRFAVNPSTIEGLPLTVLEAHALGKHVLASDIPPHRQLIQDEDWLFPPADADALSASLSALLATSIPAVDHRLIARVRQEHDWDRIAETTARIIQNQQIADGGGQGEENRKEEHK